jgi:hypothetical protein
MKRVLFAALLLLPLAAPARAAAQVPSDHDAILGVINRLFDGMRARDTALMRSLFAPEARLVGIETRDGTPTIRAMSPDTWIASVGRGTGPGPDERLFDPVVQVDENLAQVWVYYELWIGPRLNHCGYDAFLLARLGADWKVVQVADTRRSPCTPRG